MTPMVAPRHHRHICARIAAVAVLLMSVLSGAPRAQDPASRGADELAQARTLFDALDYEHAVPALDRAVAMLEPLVAQQPTVKPSLVAAYEMRARARFGLGDRDGAASDLTTLLGLEPGFTFGGQVSPRIVSLLDDIRKTVVGSLVLTVDPSDAVVEINGQTFPVSGAPIPLKASEYTIKVTRLGYRTVDQKIAVVADQTQQFSVSLERVAALVWLVTSPADVEVLLDGASRGRTAPGPPGAPYTDVPSQLGVAPETVSKPLLLTDLTQGPHVVQFKRPCLVTEERRVVIEALSDYRLDPVKLNRAVGSLTVESMPGGAAVFVDGESRGAAPLTIDDVCEGSRLVELRSPQGRYVQRLVVNAGDRAKVVGRLKPAFALVPGGSVPAAAMQTLVATVERALAGSEQVTVFQPAGGTGDAASATAKAPSEWLAFDAGRRAVGGATAISPAMRRELSAQLASALDVQGVAAISQPSPTSPDVVIALLAAGAGEPDVVSLVPERMDSVRAAMARFDFVPPMLRPTIGLLAIEAVDVPGVVVARVDPGSAAEKAGVKPGDVISGADNQPTKTPGAFEHALDARRIGDTMMLQVIEQTGTTRSVSLPVTGTPRLISAADQTLLFNPLSVAFRSRLTTASPAEQPFVRLNLGVALMRLGDFSGAQEQFEAVKLAPGHGISQGTQQYLLGLALEGLGDSPGAQRAWQAAAASEAWLTDGGPPVKPLAERRLKGGR